MLAQDYAALYFLFLIYIKMYSQKGGSERAQRLREKRCSNSRSKLHSKTAKRAEQGATIHQKYAYNIRLYLFTFYFLFFVGNNLIKHKGSHVWEGSALRKMKLGPPEKLWISTLQPSAAASDSKNLTRFFNTPPHRTIYPYRAPEARRHGERTRTCIVKLAFLLVANRFQIYAMISVTFPHGWYLLRTQLGDFEIGSIQFPTSLVNIQTDRPMASNNKLSICAHSRQTTCPAA